MKKRIIGITIFIIIIVLIVSGIFAYRRFGKMEKNDKDAVGNTAGNLYNGGLFCESEKYIYFSNPNDYNQLYRMDLNGKNIKKVHSDKARYINACNGYIYYVRYNHDSGQEVVLRGNRFGVCRIKENSDSTTELYSGLVDSLTLSGNKLYFRSYDDKDLLEIKSVDIDGENLKKISNDDFLPLSVYKANVYCSNVTDNHNIVKMDAEDASTITVKEGNYYMPIVEEGILYYIDVKVGYHLVKENLNTGEITTLTKDKCVNYNVSTKYDVIYYQCENDKDDHRLMMMNLDGGNARTVGTGDYSNIHITKNYTYYFRLTVGAEKQLFYVETGKEPSPKQFQ